MVTVVLNILHDLTSYLIKDSCRRLYIIIIKKGNLTNFVLYSSKPYTVLSILIVILYV